ncbi:MAG: Maf family protein [Dokdonella sp.]
MLFLASQSPRRRQLLEQLGLTLSTLDVDIVEQRTPGEPAEDYVNRVAREKAGAGLLQVSAVGGAVVLGADTEVIVDDEVFGKPVDAVAAYAMLRRLAGRSHDVLSIVWCVTVGDEAHAISRSTVAFAPLDDAAIRAYVATGEPFGKAGGYAIQGRAGAFVSHLDGSYSGVMGLPLYETAQLLRRFGAMGDDEA